MLYGMQADEEVRRHIYAEKMTAGSIRAMAGAAGVQTNTGSPLYYLNAQINEGLNQRQFMLNKHLQTMWTMDQEGQDKAYIYRLTASENASVIMANAELQAGVALAEAQARADAMRRSGDVAYETGQAQGSAAMWGGLGNAIGTGITGYQMGFFGAPPTSINQSFNSSSMFGTSNPYLGGWNQSQNWNSSFAPGTGYLAFGAT
mgnify:CR=1 FL=1